MTELPLPPHYDPANAERWTYSPDQGALLTAASAWRREHAVAPAAADRMRTHLLLIDVQRDFCFPQGALYVAGRSGRGAIDDNQRIAAFIYRNLPNLTRITTTMDTHYAFQLFFPSFWVDRDGAPLGAHREISAEEVCTGAVRPAPTMASFLCDGDEAWLQAQLAFYCAELERAGRYRLYLWPPHCLLGSDGHALAGVVHEARLFHSYVRQAQSYIEIKGSHALTEHYSVLQPEVLLRHDGGRLAERNEELLRTLLEADALIVAGQAASHCVKSSVEDLLSAVQARDPALARKVYLLVDCMSAVTVSDGQGGFAVDFTSQTEAALQRFADAGMHLVRSTEPMASWPALRC